jgi:hypothetical protein
MSGPTNLGVAASANLRSAPILPSRNCVKVALIAFAVWLCYRVGREIMHSPEVEGKSMSAKAKMLAVASLAAWTALIIAGRLLQYTHKWEMLGVPSLI